MTLRSFQLRLTYLTGATEDLEFTAPDLDRAAQAVADRAHRAGNPIKTIGRYDTAVEAAIAYDDAAHEIFGEFAWLNFPENYPPPCHDIVVHEIPF